MNRLIFVCAVAFLLAGSAAVCAERPIDEIKSSTDKIIAILKDPALAGPAYKTERRRLLTEEIDRRFDWQGIARGCLGRHWSKASTAQREEFLKLFRQFLERMYLDKIEPYYDELLRIDYVSERIIDNHASVKTIITTKRNMGHPVEYRLEKSANGDWRVYDAVIEGVSLVRNYRVQFDEIVARASFDDLLKDLRAKTEGLN